MKKLVAFVIAVAFVMCAPILAQQQMPNPQQISGVPLPANDLPAGTLSVRVIRGGFDKNIANQAVEFTVDGQKKVVRTDESGRSQITGLKNGAQVTVATTVEAEHLTSQLITMGGTGIRIVLVATDPEATRRAEQDRQLAAGPAVKGVVVLGPQSRVVAEFTNDQLNVFYMIDILNTSRTPVDIGGPLLIDLPREARGAGLSEDSTKQATVNGARVTVLGPFAPGVTSLRVGFELPSSGGTATLTQKFPVTLEALNLFVSQPGGLDVRSAQIANKRTMSDQGETYIGAVGPSIAAGQPLVIEISGLPHHALWPRYVALGLSGGLIAIGIWAAVFPSPRRRVA